MQLYWLCFIFCLVTSFIQITGQNNNSQNSNKWLYKSLSLPEKSTIIPKRTITVAVIDDGFRITHKDLEGFIFCNLNEIPGNFIDDDNNGFIDDYNGWDISDNDNDVSIQDGRDNEFYHGTAIAGIITGLVRHVYGTNAHTYCKIIPVKVLRNNSKNTALLDGYKGIKYAISLKPDIICCAWSGSLVPTNEEKEIIEEAHRKNCIIIASAGNFFSEKKEYPACLPGVWNIAATDTLKRKLSVSNYSMLVDFSTPGIHIKAPYPLADNSYFKPDGTSVSAAVMAGCVAILKLAYPFEINSNIEEALKNTASPIDSLNTRYSGKLGAGIPNINKALLYLSDSKKRFTYHNPAISKGTILFNPNTKTQVVSIHPTGAYEGFYIEPKIFLKKPKGLLQIFSGDSLIIDKKISELTGNFYIPGSSFKLSLNCPLKTAKSFKLNYSPKTIDSTQLFCKGVKYNTKPEGEISDGSNDQNYANYCDCKWIITVPPGKRVKFDFTEFDTQAKIDFVWLFDGEITLPENIIAKFSGPKIPPTVTSTTNKVLVWFVTDGYVTAKGWKLKYTAVDN